MGSMENSCEASIRRVSSVVKRVGEKSELSTTERGSTQLSTFRAIRFMIGNPIHDRCWLELLSYCRYVSTVMNTATITNSL